MQSFLKEVIFSANGVLHPLLGGEENFTNNEVVERGGSKMLNIQYSMLNVQWQLLLKLASVHMG